MLLERTCPPKPIVLLVSDEYPPYTSWGGNAYQMAYLARMLRGRGYDVEIIAQSDGDDEFCHLDRDGNLVHRIVATQSYALKGIEALSTRLGAWAKVGHLPFAVRVAEKVLELTTLWNRKILWIETTNWKAQTFLLHFLPSLNERCVVRIVTPLAEVHHHNGQVVDIHAREALLQEALQQVLLRHRFYSNQEYKAYFEKRVKTLPLAGRSSANERAFLLPFDFDRVPERGPRRRSAEGIVRLLVIGRLEPRKGLEDVCAALAALAPEQRAKVRVIAAGRDTPFGPRKSYLETLRARFGALSGCIDFRGEVPESGFAALFAEADVGLMPSRSESFGYSLLELVTSDLPVITADVGAASELERRGVKYLAKYRGVAELTAALASLPERLADYEDLAPDNRSCVQEIYRSEMERYFEYTRRHFGPPTRAANGHAVPRRPPVKSADLVVCTHRLDDLTRSLGSLLREARKACDAGIACRVTVVYQDDDLPERLYAWRPDLRDEPLLRLRASAPPSLPRARNVAVANTSGDLVIFVGDAAVLEPGFVLAHAEAANRHPEAAGVVGHIKGPAHLGPATARRAVGQIRASGVIETHFHSEERRAPLVPITSTGANMSYRRDVLNGLFGDTWFDHRFGGSALREASTLAIELFRSGHFLVFAPDASLHPVTSGSDGDGTGSVHAVRQAVAHSELSYFFLNHLFAPAAALRAGVPLLHVLREVRGSRGVRAKLVQGYVNLRGYLGGRSLYRRRQEEGAQPLMRPARFPAFQRPSFTD